MILRLVILALLGLVACAQDPEPARLVGSIEKLAGGELEIESGGQLFTLSADSGTEVLKGRTYHDLSPLRAGDEVSILTAKGLFGRLMAVTIWAEVVTFRASVHSVNPGSFDITTSRSAAPDSAYRQGYSRVYLYPATRFGGSPDALVEGRDVHVVGLDVGGGNVDALRVTVYNSDLPAQP